LLVDTLGLLLRVRVHPASEQDRAGAKPLLAGILKRFPRLTLIWADQGYNGKAYAEWVRKETGCQLEITKRTDKQSTTNSEIVIVARRWVVERTIGWLCRNRRLSKDYEGLPKTGEALVYMAMVRLMLKRLS
jgi:putative transposase